MNLEAFLTEGAPAWGELERLIGRAGRRPERLGVEGILELGRLYRITVADLALARREFPGDPVVERLEPLAVRARHIIYAERTRPRSLRAFFLREYWREISANRRLLAVSLTAMFVPTLLAGIWAVQDPGAAIGLVPPAYRAAADPGVRHLSLGLTTQAAFASSIYTHNITVTFMTFASGIALGFGTLALLAYNGLLLGALGGLTIQAGTFGVFVRYIVPHGLLELSCISIAGVAGLRLARGLIEPGVRPRGQALTEEARDAVQMVLGTAPWLVLAGLTEGFVTPRALPLPFALAVGIGLATLFWSLVFRRGLRGVREPSPADRPERSAPAGPRRAPARPRPPAA
ncbi:MAG: stage II sporulation protein M [Actinomycetota bacterium]|nr:stage II sporulation protein M [Actinomycetota bacterium]